MTPQIGEYALAGAMLTSLAMMLGVVFYLQTRNEGILRGIRAGLVLVAGLLGISTWSLLTALTNDNFTLEYVVRHSEKSLATYYKAAAFWAGQEGSLLFWALVLSVMSVVMAWVGRRRNDAEQVISLGVMAAVTGFFICVMLFAGNPFDLATTRATNGEGLNPLLQNLAMVIHPPMLFLGYAGFTAPFALLMGALAAGRKESEWLRVARPWMVYSWVVLTVGVVLGAQWAYVELGWGGYWAWDPVENASILPWFTGTALLHSAVLTARRGIFKGWTASLVAASFFLCVFGTYLTRSGVIQSVHAFGESPIGKFFLVFLGVIGVASVGVLLLRRTLLRADHPIEDYFSREGFILLANVLLCVMTAVTLVGTIFPILSGWFNTTPVTVNAAFYNKVILPLALVVAALMATGPVVGQGSGAGKRAIRKLAGMVVAGGVAAGTVAGLGYVSVWALFSAFIIAAVVAGVGIDLVVSLRAIAGQNIFVGLGRVFGLRSRHWGAQLAHVGLAAIIAGVAGSSVYGVTDHLQLKTASAAGAEVAGHVGAYTVTLKKFEEVRRPNHTAIVARVQVRDAKGNTFELQPERRFYDRGMDKDQSASEVAIHFGLGSDVYLMLDGWEDGGESVTVGTIINPLVNWIWIGGALLTLGGLLCLIPSRRAQHAAAEPTLAEAIARAHTHGKGAHRVSSRKRHQTVATGSQP